MPLLDALFRDSGPGGYAARALCEIGDPAVVEPLLQRLPASSNLQCWHSLLVLQRFPDARALEPLRRELNSRNFDFENWHERQFQAKLLYILGQLGDANAPQQLQALLNRVSERQRFFFNASFAQFAPGTP